MLEGIANLIGRGGDTIIFLFVKEWPAMKRLGAPVLDPITQINSSSFCLLLNVLFLSFLLLCCSCINILNCPQHKQWQDVVTNAGNYPTSQGPTSEAELPVEFELSLIVLHDHRQEASSAQHRWLGMGNGDNMHTHTHTHTPPVSGNETAGWGLPRWALLCVYVLRGCVCVSVCVCVTVDFSVCTSFSLIYQL